MRKTVLVSIVVLLGLLLGPAVLTTAAPTAAPTPVPTATQISTPTTPSLFRFMKSVDVTPAGSLVGGSFVRIGYVPGKDRIVVTFGAKLDQPEGGCSLNFGYAYREYILDMVETGDDGVISCQPVADYGGLFDGDTFFLAAMGRDEETGAEGWYLTQYDAVTWTILAGPFFHSLTTGEDPGDPMLAIVNGQLDISSTYRSGTDDQGTPPPLRSYATHHQFFTPDLQFIGERILSDLPHINLSSMLAANGITHFVAGTALLGDLVEMQYDPNWNYLGGKTIMENATCPEGLASDGTRFYVAYLDNALCTGFPCYQNVHLAAFDSDWNLIEDVAVTDYVPDDHKQTSRPTLTLWKNRIYVAWDQTNDEMFAPGQDPHNMDIQVYVKVYDLAIP